MDNEINKDNLAEESSGGVLPEEPETSAPAEAEQTASGEVPADAPAPQTGIQPEAQAAPQPETQPRTQTAPEPVPQAASQQPAAFQPQYVPPYAMPQYGAAMTAPPPPPKKRLSKGWIIAITAVITAMFAAIVVLTVFVVKEIGRLEDIKDKAEKPQYGFNTEAAEAPEANKSNNVVINLPVSAKPVTAASDYVNEETGLFTSEGLAKYIMPSQVLIGIYNDTPYEMTSAGSGIVLTSDGYILTNAHVIDGAHNIKTIMNDGAQYEAKITGIDRTSDLAVIKINAENLIAADLGDSDSAVLGEEVAVVGAAGAFETSITFGHISALNREIETDYSSSGKLNCIQTDAALNPGNSGGALVNMYGQVIGISVGGLNHLVYDGIGFAIEINDAIPVAEKLIANGYVPGRARLGITFYSIDTDLSEQYGVPLGLCIMEVDETCDISLTNIQPYDIITAIDGIPVYNSATITKAMDGKYAGDRVTLTVYRKTMTDEEIEFKVSVMLEQKYDT